MQVTNNCTGVDTATEKGSSQKPSRAPINKPNRSRGAVGFIAPTMVTKKAAPNARVMIGSKAVRAINRPVITPSLNSMARDNL